MKLEIVKAADYGLEESKAAEISALFTPMLDKMVELEKEYNKIIKLDPSEENCAKAKELRLRYVKIRTGTNDLHKNLKRFYLNGGRFVDALKNTQIMAGETQEAGLKQFENHFENIEKEKMAKLQAERTAILDEMNAEFIPDNVGEMTEEVWKGYLRGIQLDQKEKLEEEKKAEAERVELENKKRLLEERKESLMPFHKFVDYSKLTIDMNEKEFDALLNKGEKDLAEYEKEQEQIRVDNERLTKEAVERDKKEVAKRKVEDDKLQAQQEKTRKAEEKLQAQKDKEAQAEQDRQREIEVDLNKGDADKVKDLVADLEGLKGKYVFKSVKNKKMYSDVGELIDKVIVHINK